LAGNSLRLFAKFLPTRSDHNAGMPAMRHDISDHGEPIFNLSQPRKKNLKNGKKTEKCAKKLACFS
jgi:hypothetical protein